MLGPSTQSDVNLRERLMELPNRIDQQIGDQVLARYNMYFLWSRRFLKEATEMIRLVEKCFGMGQELLSLGSERCSAAKTATLLIEFDPQPSFERQQATAQALFRNKQRFGGRSQTSLSGELNEGGNLVGR